MKTLVWTVMMYGAKGWTLRKSDEKKIKGAEMFFTGGCMSTGPRKEQIEASLKNLGKNTTTGTSHQKETYILGPCILTPGKWTNKIDVPRKSMGKRR